MSQVPPPIPPSLPPREPLRAQPVTPLPVESISVPYASQPPGEYAYGRGYGGATPGGRPGTVTAMGVTSIVIACLSIFASGFTGCAGMVFFKQAQVVTRMARTNANASFLPPTPQGGAATATGASAAVGPTVEARGMAEGDRRAVLATLGTMEVLTPERTRQADAILAKAGQDILPLGALGVTDAGVREAVRDHGTGLSSNPEQAAPIFFETAGGTLTVYDDRAVFRPFDGTPSVSAWAVAADDAAGPAPPVVAVAPSPPGGNAPAIPPAPTGGPVDPFAEDPPEAVATPTTVPAGPASNVPATSGGPNWAKGQPPLATPTPRTAIHPMSMVLVIGEAMMSGGLAIYLLTIGILTLRGSPNARRLHQIYAAVKIPLAVAGAVAFAWLMSELAQFLQASGGGGAVASPGLSTFTTISVTLAGMGTIYPLVLLIVLRRKALRDYFDAGASRPF